MKLKSVPQFAPALARTSVYPIVFSAALLFSASAFAQVMMPPGTFQGHGQLGLHGGQIQPPSQNQNQPAAEPAPLTSTAAVAPEPASSGLPPSLLDQPAQPAKVDLAAGTLTIHADNSSLTAILQQVSTSAGMTIDGLSKDERIFGTYGPGNPHEILSALLDGTGYNVLMFGETTAKTPRQITLTPRGAAGVSGPSNPVHPIQQNQDDEEDDSQQQPQAQDSAPPANPNPPAAPPTSNGVRSPQQMLQELQQMRQQQQQEQPQPPQQN
jgi:hypothetical protein